MISPHRNSRIGMPTSSPVKTKSFLTVTTDQMNAATVNDVTPGSLNDSTTVRGIVADAMRKCSRSRAEIADTMSSMTGTSVTEIQLNKYASESRDDYRFPCELQRAFCAATGDDRLITYAAQGSGFQLITEEEVALLELGREYLRQKDAAAKMAAIEAQLSGVRFG